MRIRSLYVIICPSVVYVFVLSLSCHQSSVTFVHPTQAMEIFGNVSTPFSTLAVVDMQVKFYVHRPRSTLPSGELNTREIYPNIAILHLSNVIYRKRCKIGDKLVLITNRKLHMAFRLLPN